MTALKTKLLLLILIVTTGTTVYFASPYWLDGIALEMEFTNVQECAKITGNFQYGYYRKNGPQFEIISDSILFDVCGKLPDIDNKSTYMLINNGRLSSIYYHPFLKRRLGKSWIYAFPVIDITESDKAILYKINKPMLGRSK